MSLDLAPCFTVENEDFGEAELQAIYNVVNFGKDITFGSEKEIKTARDSVHTIILTGNAIKQIEAGELSELTQGNYALGPKSSQKYRDEWDRAWLEEHEKLPKDSKQRFTYTYIERLIRTYGDQFARARELLADMIKKAKEAEAAGKHPILSNRLELITWNPEIDMGADAPPCFQRAWIRYYHPLMIDLHLSWRSRDLRDAWKYNIIGGVAAFNKEIFFPNNCRIVRIIDQCDSLHIYIYNGSLVLAKEVLSEAEAKHPEIMKKFRIY